MEILPKRLSGNSHFNSKIIFKDSGKGIDKRILSNNIFFEIELLQCNCTTCIFYLVENRKDIGVDRSSQLKLVGGVDIDL